MMRDYEEKIQTFLNEKTEPLDVEKIRITCGIANWNTALKHCLELLIQGKIQGQKTSKGWVFWAFHETRLEPWQEIIGHYQSLKINQDKVTVILSHTLPNTAITFPKETVEAQTLLQTLKNTQKGTKIAILKTDNPQKPLTIRTYTATPDAENEHLWLRQLRRSLLWYAFKGYALKFSLWLSELRLSWWF